MRILLIITGSIAAYKALEFIRRAREHGHVITPVLTKGAQEFITPLSAASLAEQPAYTELFSLKDETEMGHIRLARETDVVLIAPASADFMASMAQGKATDLATTLYLAADKPVYLAPAMNVKMWEAEATQRNLAQLQKDGVRLIAPAAGEMACGEVGTGRMAEVFEILHAVESAYVKESLRGKHVLITAGPTHEPIDPVRYIANRSSGKQGYAIAQAFQLAGARVTLVSGPTQLAAPYGVEFVPVTTAQQMAEAVERNLPAEIGIFTAAVADWRMKEQGDSKLKKRASGEPPVLELAENPDILKTVCAHEKRPHLVIGFAAETDEVKKNAQEKLARKGCDAIVATDVAGGAVFGEEHTKVMLITQSTVEDLGQLAKTELANHLVEFAAANSDKVLSMNISPKRKPA